ncbi:MAG: hypothetical protein GX674_07430 [Clostridiales bacterium]|nr:hypothetical protein [Clostridiales bacterium]
MNKEQLIREWALGQLGSAYVYGATGALCTPAQRQSRMAQYPSKAEAIKASCPSLSGQQEDCRGCGYSGKQCFDCAQFVRRALEQGGIKLPSGASSQWKAGLWAWKGEMSDQAHSRLCVVFRSSGSRQRPMSHVGLSLGDGRVMDARGHTRGVMLSQIGQYPWTHYALVNLHEQEEDGEMESHMEQELLPGDRGERVKAMQTLLLQKGFALPRFGADGRFGKETLAALHEAQKRLGLDIGDGAGEALFIALQAAGTSDGQAAGGLTAMERRLDSLAAELAGCRAALHRIKGMGAAAG